MIPPNKQVLFSSWQDPRSWDVNAAAHGGPVITCATNADAKKAERLFNDLLERVEKAEAALSARTESRGTCPKCGTVLVLQPEYGKDC